jgi:glycosyltransferase involved in cell wall biosynthesis
MKIIIVSWHFPPANTIAAVRIGKLARYLIESGHQVRVQTVEQATADQSLPLEVSERIVERIRYLDVDRMLDPRRWPSSPIRPLQDQAGTAVPTSKSRRMRRLSGLSELYRGLAFIPDRQVGWGRYLLPGLIRLTKSFGPDLILASGPPFSTFLWTAIAAHRTKVPWIAEFRDRWADDMYTEIPTWRRPLDRWLEHRVIGSAAGIVTVSEPWREVYGSEYKKPTITVMNGYDPNDVTDERPPAALGLPLTIMHVGTIYRGRRDPRLLFRALIEGRFKSRDIRVVFYGRYLDWIDDLARELGVREFVELHEPVPYTTALRLQSTADLLLLLQWDDPGEVGNVPGKLFEYFASRRPIVGLGPEGGVPARLIRERKAGLFTNDPRALANYLQARVGEKHRTGSVAPLPLAARKGFTRNEQYTHLETFLRRWCIPAEQPGRAETSLEGGRTGSSSYTV